MSRKWLAPRRGGYQPEGDTPPTPVTPPTGTAGVITPNRGNNPCVCGAIHPCCRFLVNGGCAHRTPGDHHHAPNVIAEWLKRPIDPEEP